MDAAIRELGVERIPLSISLVQFVFASLFTAGMVLEPLDGYCPVITSELETLYPALSFKYLPRQIRLLTLALVGAISSRPTW